MPLAQISSTFDPGSTINGCLIRFANFTPIAATLAMYIGLQGLSFVLRDGPGGYINFAVMDVIGWKLQAQL